MGMICTVVVRLFLLSFWHHLVSSFTREFISISQSCHFVLGKELNSKTIPHAMLKKRKTQTKTNWQTSSERTGVTWCTGVSQHKKLWCVH